LGTLASGPIPIQGKNTLIKSLGLEYNLSYTWDDQHEALMSKFHAVAVTLSRRNASIMAKSLLQNVSSVAKIAYAGQFSAVLDQQWSDVNNLLVRPLRASKAVGCRLAGSVITNPSLGGFALDMEAVINRAKLRLMDRAFNEGGATACAMRGLVLRLARRGYHDHTVCHEGDLSIPPPIDGRNSRDW
jgi:hypothetical protein